jgi:hypothetical protein
LNIFYGSLLNDFRKVWSKTFLKHPTIVTENLLPEVSVISPFRNEVNNIENLINQLSKLDYPTEKLSFIFVDDNSDDQSHLNFSNINGTLPINKGGTGKNSLENEQILIGNTNVVQQTSKLSWNDTSSQLKVTGNISANKLIVTGDISGNNNLCLNDKCINSATLSNLIDFAKYLNDIKVVNGIPILGMAGSGHNANSPADGKYTIISNGLTLPNELLTFVAPTSNRVQAKFRFGIKEINGITKYATIKNSSNTDMIAELIVNNTDNPQVKVYFDSTREFNNNLSLSLAVLERERLVNNVPNWVVVDTRQITSNTSNILYSITDTAFKN